MAIEYDVEEIKGIITANNNFNEAMLNRMIEKFGDGFKGWDDPLYEENVVKRLTEKIEQNDIPPRDLVDIANYCMILYNMRTY